MTDTPAVYACIQQAMRKLNKHGVAKRGRNLERGYQFRQLDDIVEKLSPILASVGLLVLPRMIGHEWQKVQGDYGGTLFHSKVTVEFDFVAVEDGSKHVVTMLGEAFDEADKSTTKAAQSAYKYALVQTFGIKTGDTEADERTLTAPPGLEVAPTPQGPLTIVKVTRENTRTRGSYRWIVTFSDGRRMETYDDRTAFLCEQIRDEKSEIHPPEFESGKRRPKLIEVHRLATVASGYA